jgi:hypothetical protein
MFQNKNTENGDGASKIERGDGAREMEREVRSEEPVARANKKRREIGTSDSTSDKQW